ncbi:MAG TPA: ATPase, T2SS/T4P/T4SS family [Kiritimatiellia bacterium]|nr:ATPase, T2SS/T4P/T4SS family [Kiritimatiellia bacterium]
MKRPQLGQMLIDAGLLNEAQLDQAIRRKDHLDLKLGEYLCRTGLVREDQITALLAQQLDLGIYDPERFPVNIDLAPLVPYDIAQRYTIVPLRKQGQIIFLGMVDPTNLRALDTIEQITHCEVVPIVCTNREWNQLSNAIYGQFAGLGDVISSEASTSPPSDETAAEEIEVGSLKTMAEGAPVVRMVNWIVTQAVREGASDIHISPEEQAIQLRFRVDGKLREVPGPPKSLHLPLVSRIKILAKLDIAVSRIPQDGRFAARVDNREINIRVSTLPTTHGENVVMRLLDTSGFNFTLNDLGMAPKDRERITLASQSSYGLILSTGPTGSGKSTSLYAILKQISRPDINIITVEDPVEYRIPGIRQVQLNPRAGMTFASGLRAILRQDPDVIMVGEIRDAETARIAVQAALTGHRVLSTVHTNDAAGAVTRMIDMGIEPFLVSSVLLVSFAQRLIRKICPHCAEDYIPAPDVLEFWGFDPANPIPFKRGKGCGHCQHSGHAGRTAVFEVFSLNEHLREMISHSATTLELNRAAKSTANMLFLKDAAAEKLRLGITSVEEALSVVNQ